MPESAADWLLAQGRVENEPEALVGGLAEQLQATGVPLLRSSAWLPTLHPELWGSQLVWSRGEGCRVIARPHDVVTTSTFLGTPGQAMVEGAAPIRCRLDAPREQLPFAMLGEIAEAGGVEYFIMPIEWGHGMPVAWITFTTDRPTGFRDDEIETILGLRPLLSLHFQLLAARFAKRSLLTVYLGPNAAQQVMAGSFRRGGGTMIGAAIWFCDLRGFTGLGDRLTARELVGVLDRYFECVAGPIEAHGGEILKLIGDAALAIFPVSESGPDEPCLRAFRAAEGALEALSGLRREQPDWPPLSMGVALHLGEVMYGNIGGRGRLDFTVIGAAVNEVCRVESLCKVLGVPLLMTSTFAEHLRGVDTVPLGHHVLRGVSQAQEVRTTRALAPPST